MSSSRWRALAVCALMLSAPVLACKRDGPSPTLEDDAASAASILIVRVQRLDEILDDLSPDAFYMPARASFEVLEVLKGPGDVQRQSLTGASSCDVPLWPGVTYVLLFDQAFANGQLVMPLQTSFALIEDEEGELEQLRELLAIQPRTFLEMK